MLNRIKIAFCVCVILLATIWVAQSNAKIPALSKYGSRGEEVRQIQTKLATWGYNVGNIDGIYGTKTQQAVMDYQRKNGLKVDGIAGPQTLDKMGVNVTNTQQAKDNDAALLARIINAEARGEPYSGQVAVGAVVLNRVKHPSFPNTISGVIFQPGAFSSMNDGQWDAAMYNTPYQAAQDALKGADPTGGAIYFYNPTKTSSQWMLSRPVNARIGAHVFAR